MVRSEARCCEDESTRASQMQRAAIEAFGEATGSSKSRATLKRNAARRTGSASGVRAMKTRRRGSCCAHNGSSLASRRAPESRRKLGQGLRTQA